MKKAYAIAIGTATAVVCAAILAWPGEGLLTDAGDVPWAEPKVDRDLKAIRLDTLRVLVLDHPLSWEQWPKEETGLEFELLERFVKRENLVMRVIPVAQRDSMLAMLQRGAGDVIAGRLTSDDPVSQWIRTTSPYHSEAPMLATLRMESGSSAKSSGSADTTWLNNWSPLAQDMGKLGAVVDGKSASGKGTMALQPGDAQRTVLDLALGRITNAWITDAEAVYYAPLMPQLAFGPRMGSSVPLVFGVRRNARALLKAMNSWLADTEEQEAQEYIIGSYGGRIPRRGMLGGKARSMEGDSISPYDSLFQLHVDSLRWDWELLAAVAFKESRFDTTAVSQRGAQGMMQMMPGTAASMGMDTTDVVGGQVQAASRYLSSLDGIWMRSIPNTDQRLRFVLAAYNAGPGHVIDAQHLAKDIGLDPLKWEGNVERAITLLALPRYFMRDGIRNGRCKGSDTFLYVREVISTYARFRKRSKG